MDNDKLFFVKINHRDSQVEYTIETRYKTGSIIPVPLHIHYKLNDLVAHGYENSAINQLMVFNPSISNETATVIVDSIKYPDKY
jgi:hypothetical protein